MSADKINFYDKRTLLKLSMNFFIQYKQSE